MPRPIPVRDLAQHGIVQDVNSFDLPPSAFSKGNNVRFDNGKVSRAPIYRDVHQDLGDPVIRFCYGVSPTNDSDFVVYSKSDGALWKYQNGGTVDLTPATGYSLGADVRPWTADTLGDVVYMNQPFRVPHALLPAAAEFQPLTGWDGSWRCGAMRAFKDQLIAMDVTKGAVRVGNMVKWSDITQAGQMPGSWDETSTTNSAGENILAEMDSEIVDGFPLKNVFILYGRTQIWMMEFVGGRFIYNFRKLFTDAGIINQNCVTEIEGKHYVFGVNDIYVHDGTSRQSIADQRVRDAIFRALNNKEADKFYVTHNPLLNEVLFCYVSGDADAKFQDTTYCNRAAVFNYRNNTWSFVDLPNTTSGTVSNVNQVLTWAQVTAQWNLIGGSWYDQEDGLDRHLVMTSCGDSTVPWSVSHLLGVDLADLGSLSYERFVPSDATAYAERTGIDLDEAGSSLRGYKVVRALLPQITTFRAPTLGVQVGSHIVSSAPVTYSQRIEFNPATDYKIDVRSGGRYLAWKVTMETPNDFEISGYDLDVVITGRR